MSAAPQGMLRIVYPVMWGRPGRQACREQSVSTAAALARLGHSVVLLLPKRPQDPPLAAEELRDYYEVEGDLAVVQHASRWVGENAIASGLWLQQVFRTPEARGADLLLSRIPMLLALGAASPVPFALDHYRLWPDDLPPIRPLIRRTARSPKCLGLIAHSAHARNSYLRCGVPGDKLLVAHNGASALSAVDGLGRGEARIRLGLPPTRPIAAYAGRLNLRKGLDQLLALARLRPHVLFLLIGSEGAGPIEREARELDNVQVLPWQRPSALRPWLAAADVLVIPSSRAPLERFRNCVLPMKLFTYLAAGRPILAPDAADTAELLVDGRTALRVPPDQPSAAAVALDRVLADPALAARLGENAHQLGETLTWDCRARTVSAFLHERLTVARSRRRVEVSALSIDQDAPADEKAE